MQRVSLAVAAILVMSMATPSHAERWLEYDLHGRGPYQFCDSSGEGTYCENGRADVFWTIFVETDPASLEDTGDLYFSDGVSFAFDVLAGRRRFATAQGNQLELEAADDCDRGGCTQYTIHVNYPLGVPVLPDHPPLHAAGDFTVDDSGFASGILISGRIVGMDVKPAHGPAEWQYGYSLAPVPEPSTWMMLVGGFALSGIIRRLRQTGSRPKEPVILPRP